MTHLAYIVYRNNRLTLHKVHDHIQLVGILKGIMQADDEWMFDCCQDIPFSLRAFNLNDNDGSDVKMMNNVNQNKVCKHNS